MKSETYAADPSKPPKKDSFDKYEVDSACDTLLRAEEIKKNKALFAACQKKLAGKIEAIKSIADLRRVASEKQEESEEQS